MSEIVKNKKIIAKDNHKKDNKTTLKGVKKYLVFTLTGLCIGFLNGFFGGGGGMVAVPLLENVLKFDVKKSHATAIFIILPLCITSIITYYLAGTFDFNSGWYICLGVVGGGILGAILLKKLNSKIVGFIFAILMIVAGTKLCIS